MPVAASVGPSRGAIALLLVAIAAVFARGLLGGFVYDDQELIAGNPWLHDPLDVTGLWSRPLWGEQLGHWRPLTAQLLAIGWWLGGGTPWAIHALALLLHLCSALAVMRLWRLLGGDGGHGGRGGGALLAAALFALHPAQAESVAWCSALNDVLAGGATLWALAFWLGERRALAWLCAAVAMLAKEGGALAPLLLVAGDLLLGRQRQPRPWRALPPALLLLLGYWALRALVFGELAAGLGRHTHTAEQGPLALGTAIASGLLAHLLLPLGNDLFAAARDVGLRDHALAILAAYALLWCFRSIDRRRFAALLALAPIALPALLNGNLGPYPIADRYLYLACGGLALLLAALPGRARWLAVALAAAMTPVTFAHVGDFRDQTTLVDAALRHHPDDARLHYMRGRDLLERAADPTALAAARTAFERARELLATTPKARLMAEVQNALANCSLFASQGTGAPDATRLEREFAQIVQGWPDYPDAYVGLGIVLASTGRAAGAENAFRRAIELDPATPGAQRNLGRLLLLTDRAGDAIPFLQQAQRIAPGDPAVQQLLEQATAQARAKAGDGKR